MTNVEGNPNAQMSGSGRRCLDDLCNAADTAACTGKALRHWDFVIHSSLDIRRSTFFSCRS